MPFNILKKMAGNVVNRYSGQTDFLEAVCAGAALVAAADGSIDPQEEIAATKAVAANANLAGAFNARQIEQTMQAMFQRAEGGRVGRQGLYTEISEIAKDPEKAETVLLTVLDVADHGGIDDTEMAVVERIASTLSLDAKKYLV